MPKARSAILSSLRGSLRGGPTFRDTTQTDAIVMQTRPVPTDRRTAKQAAIRDAYSRLAYLWKNLSHLDKEPYEIMAEARNLTPWNCWLSFHLPLMRLTPRFYTAFAEGAGTSIQDFTIGGLTGTANGPVWQEKNQFPYLSFDGVDDRITFARPTYYDTASNFSIFAIVIPDSPNTNWGIIAATEGQYGRTTGFLFSILPNHTPYLEIGTGTSRIERTCSKTVPLDTLSVIGVTRNNNKIYFYVDGTVVTYSIVTTPMVTSGRSFCIGQGSESTTRFDGSIFINSIFHTPLDTSVFAALDAYYRPFFT